MNAILEREDLLFRELSYKVVGCAFYVFNKIGSGHLEKIYQRAMAAAFEKEGLEFKEQLRTEIYLDQKFLGYGKLDFLVEEKIVVELKRGNYFHPADFDQVKDYLVSEKLELGILVRFTPDKVITKRVVNLESYKKECILSDIKKSA